MAKLLALVICLLLFYGTGMSFTVLSTPIADVHGNHALL